MKPWIQKLLLLSTLGLTACSSYKDSSICCDKNSLNEKAVVVLDAIAPYKYFLTFNREVPVDTYWERIEPVSPADKKIEYWFKASHNDHMVLPGTYKMTGYGYQIGRLEYYTDCPKHSHITFTAAPGDFIYLGDVIIKDAQDRTSVPLLEDAFDKSIACVKNSLPNIKKPLEKKLIKGLKLCTLIEIRN